MKRLRVYFDDVGLRMVIDPIGSETALWMVEAQDVVWSVCEACLNVRVAKDPPRGLKMPTDLLTPSLFAARLQDALRDAFPHETIEVFASEER